MRWLKSFSGVLMAWLGCVTASDGAISLASGYYYQDFNGGASSVSGAEWAISSLSGGSASLGVQNVYAPGPSTVVNGTSGNGIITPNGNGNSFDLGGASVAPLRPSGSFSNYGFGGGWLINTNDTTTNPAVRTATLSFTDLPAHTTLSLGMLLAAGDSIDTGEGVFSIRVDGVTVFLRDFDSGGNYSSTGAVGVDPSRLNTTNQPENLNPYYREVWNATTTSAADRSVSTWTLDSAYSLNLAIAHTSSTATIEFVWHNLSSGFGDEYIAVDNLMVAAVPEPSKTVLLMVALAGLMMRRRR